MSCTTGKSSAWFEHSIDNRKAAGSTFPEQVFCGQVNRCHAGLISHASGVQLASPQPIFWGSRSTGGPLACNQQMRVQFPPLPPSSPGRPLRSRRRSEKPDKHVQLVPLAPSVTVAEWLRRQTVDLGQKRRRLPTLSADKVTSTASPLVGGFNSLRSPQLCGRRSTDIEHFGPNEEMPVRFRPPVPVFS